MNREEVENFIKENYGAEAEFPWRAYPRYAVFRHGENKKWFAVLMEVPKEKLGLSGGEWKEEPLPVMNLKLEPAMVDVLRNEPGFFPAYHMNKTHWITVLLNGTVDRERILELLDQSFFLTAPKRKERAMEIREIRENKKRFLSLLLLADEQEDMIDRYLNRGRLYVLYDERRVRGECVVTDEGDGVLELKSLAVEPEFQGKGYGRALIEFISKQYRGQYKVLQAGTGDSPLTVPFYERCGFEKSHRIENFFTDHYDHPIWEGGVLLKDMVYLRKKL